MKRVHFETTYMFLTNLQLKPFSYEILPLYYEDFMFHNEATYFVIFCRLYLSDISLLAI